MNATFGISAFVEGVQFCRQLRLVSLLSNNKPVPPPYQERMTPEAASFGMSATFEMDSGIIGITPRQLVGDPQLICPVIEGSITGFGLYNPHWYTEYILEFYVFSYAIKPDESGIFQFQKVIGADGMTRWTNPAL